LCLDDYTGFIFGSSSHNCLTWMDKMGSSDKAGNRGVPATPRDGAPIEMTALLKACLDLVVKWNKVKLFEKESVVTSEKNTLSFKDWAVRIQSNFDKYYWIPADVEHYKEFVLNPKMVGRKGIYKDSYKASREVEDYYLRPNACIAIAVAPSLFVSKERVMRFLSQAEKWLIKEDSIGMKTLDPKEHNYHPDYENSDDSDRKNYAHGFSYHNGPEWVWVYGMFLLAGVNSFIQELTFPAFVSFLTNHRLARGKTDWISLTELTNDNGTFNRHSCPAQAWSVATILEAVFEAKKLIKH